MPKKGDIVVYNNRLWRVGYFRLNGTCRLTGLNGEGYTYAPIKHLQLATSLIRELV